MKSEVYEKKRKELHEWIEFHYPNCDVNFYGFVLSAWQRGIQDAEQASLDAWLEKQGVTSNDGIQS